MIVTIMILCVDDKNHTTPTAGDSLKQFQKCPFCKLDITMYFTISFLR